MTPSCLRRGQFTYNQILTTLTNTIVDRTGPDSDETREITISRRRSNTVEINEAVTFLTNTLMHATDNKIPNFTYNNKLPNNMVQQIKLRND